MSTSRRIVDRAQAILEREPFTTRSAAFLRACQEIPASPGAKRLAAMVFQARGAA